MKGKGFYCFFSLHIIDIARVSFIMITHARNVVSISQLRLLTIFCSVGMSQLFSFHQHFFVIYFLLCGLRTKTRLLHSKMGLCTCVSAIPLRLRYCNSRCEIEPVAMLGRRNLLHRATPFFQRERRWKQPSGNAKCNTSLCSMSPILGLTGSGDVGWALPLPTQHWRETPLKA